MSDCTGPCHRCPPCGAAEDPKPKYLDQETEVINTIFETLMSLHFPKDRKRIVRYFYERFEAQP